MAVNRLASASPPASAVAGVIHDIGYQHYDGPRLGRRQILLALCWHSLRSAFGIRRGAKAKIVPIFAFVVMCAPAVVNAVAMALSSSHARIVPYDTYLGPLRVVVMLVFLAAQAPELVARDLRSRVLPLYFARPIRRRDYPAAKYLAFVLACLAMLDIPLLLLYVGAVLQVHGGSAIWGQTKALLPGLLLGVMWAVVLAAIGLALACLSGRRAFSSGAVAIFLLMTYVLAKVLTTIVSQQPRGLVGPSAPAAATPAAAHLLSLISPFNVLDGVRQWLGGTSPGIVSNPGSYGLWYGIALLAFLGVSLAGLFARYSRADFS